MSDVRDEAHRAMRRALWLAQIPGTFVLIALLREYARHSLAAGCAEGFRRDVRELRECPTWLPDAADLFAEITVATERGYPSRPVRDAALETAATQLERLRRCLARAPVAPVTSVTIANHMGPEQKSARVVRVTKTLVVVRVDGWAAEDVRFRRSDGDGRGIGSGWFLQWEERERIDAVHGERTP